MCNVYEEVKSRGANILTITDKTDLNRENVIVIPHNKTFSFLLSVLPFQYLAYYIAIKKNYNPDFPRNLAKVVTVD